MLTLLPKADPVKERKTSEAHGILKGMIKLKKYSMENCNMMLVPQRQQLLEPHCRLGSLQERRHKRAVKLRGHSGCTGIENNQKQQGKLIFKQESQMQ